MDNKIDNEEDEYQEPLIIIDPRKLPDQIEDRAKWFHYIGSIQKEYSSPIDISIRFTETLQLLPLTWNYYSQIPKLIKFTNTGFTLLLCAKFAETATVPYLENGPLPNKYLFSQLHFHWGRNNLEGSEHSVEGTRYPLEMHIVHFNNKYASQEEALGQLDGLCVVVYFFQLSSEDNQRLQILINHFENLKEAKNEVKIKNLDLGLIVRPFGNDYFLYWGSASIEEKVSPVIWIINRQPMGISMNQAASFRNIMDTDGHLLEKNFQDIRPLGKKRLFHVNKSNNLISTLLPLVS